MIQRPWGRLPLDWTSDFRVAEAIKHGGPYAALIHAGLLLAAAAPQWPADGLLDVRAVSVLGLRATLGAVLAQATDDEIESAFAALETCGLVRVESFEDGSDTIGFRLADEFASMWRHCRICGAHNDSERSACGSCLARDRERKRSGRHGKSNGVPRGSPQAVREDVRATSVGRPRTERKREVQQQQQSALARAREAPALPAPTRPAAAAAAENHPVDPDITQQIAVVLCAAGMFEDPAAAAGKAAELAAAGVSAQQIRAAWEWCQERGKAPGSMFAAAVLQRGWQQLRDYARSADSRAAPTEHHGGGAYDAASTQARLAQQRLHDEQVAAEAAQRRAQSNG